MRELGPHRKMQRIAKEWKEDKEKMAKEQRQTERMAEIKKREDERLAPMREILKRAGPIPKKKKTT